MKIEIKKLDGTKRQINIEAAGDTVKKKFEEVFVRLAKEAKVPGFRPGHAPRDMLEKHYSAYVHEQVAKELVPDLYNQAIEKEGLDVVVLPDISDIKLERVNISFRAMVEVTPEIKLGSYKGIKLNYKKITVTAEEIKRQLDSLKESRKQEVVDDNFVRSLGYPHLNELQTALEKQIFLDKENQQRRQLEESLVEQITGPLSFALPEGLVNRQLQDLLRQAKLDLALKGFSREESDQHQQQLAGELQPEAKKQVKVYLVLAAVAKKENIPLDDNMPRRVMELLLREADWQESSE
jgi:FKBP-type peptidyl-prolyl cis-trans isomerase (trigger factor)